MNGAQLQAWAARNKVLLAGGGGVAVLALLMRSRASKSAGTTVPASVTPATADTSAYDTYNGLSGQLSSWEDSIQAQIDGLTAGGVPGSTTPAPTPPPMPINISVTLPEASASPGSTTAPNYTSTFLQTLQAARTQVATMNHESTQQLRYPTSGTQFR